MPDPGNEKLIKKTTLKRVSKFNHGQVTRRVQKKKNVAGNFIAGWCKKGRRRMSGLVAQREEEFHRGDNFWAES